MCFLTKNKTEQNKTKQKQQSLQSYLWLGALTLGFHDVPRCVTKFLSSSNKNIHKASQASVILESTSLVVLISRLGFVGYCKNKQTNKQTNQTIFHRNLAFLKKASHGYVYVCLCIEVKILVKLTLRAFSQT